jgi:PII-like signaling protein
MSEWLSRGSEGVLLHFVLHENRRFHGKLVYEWLLQEARNIGIPGGCAFRGIAGYGRHGVLLEEHFFELAADLPVEVRFFCSQADAARLLEAVERADLSLFYGLSPVRYGLAGSGPDRLA